VSCKPKQRAETNPSNGTQIPIREITFNAHIAPLLWEKCANCHRPGESAPFPLLTYDDAKKRAKQIMEVTGRGSMPPWMPVRDGRLKHERSLTSEEMALLQQWVEEGAHEGTEALPAMPKWPAGWQLGQPDLILEPPKAYSLAASGVDEYRNLVVPCPMPRDRFVKAVEFQPGTRAVHHAFIKVDKTGGSRSLDGKDGAPGFPGLHGNDSAQMPEGQLLSWQPGKMPATSPDGCWWLLPKNNNFVFQLHLQPTGKAEEVKPRLGLYFTDEAPTKTPFKIQLVSYKFNIPAGAKRYLVQQAMVLPCDIDVLRILPHAHFLAAKVEADALQPNGIVVPLINIPLWNFNWQGDYEYNTPLFLPKGTTVRMRYTYDNSADNPRNPNNPPVPIRYGPATTNEMAELWLQTVPRDPAQRAALERAQDAQNARALKELAELTLSQDPNDLQANIDAGKLMMREERLPAALARFEVAIRAHPQSDQAHYYRAVTLRMMNRTVEAVTGFETVLRLNPNHTRAHGNLAVMYGELGDLASCRNHVNEALLLDPHDPVALDLKKLLDQRHR